MRQLKAYASRALELPLDVAIRKGAALLVRRSRKSAVTDPAFGYSPGNATS